MTAVPDPAELAPASGPRPPPRRGFGPMFWVAMTFALACFIAAAAVAVGFGVVHLAGGPRAGPSTSAPPAARPVPAPLPAPAMTPAALAPPAAPGDVETRLRRLELTEAASGRAAAEAMAAILLDEAAGSGPFTRELAAARALAPQSLALTALAPFAESGAPSRAELALALDEAAGAAAVAAREPDRGAGFLAQIGYALSRIVSVRRVAAPASASDANLIRAERLARAGRLDETVAVLDALPPPARAALADWREAALRRIAIDRALASLRAEAAAALTPGAP